MNISTRVSNISRVVFLPRQTSKNNIKLVQECKHYKISKNENPNNQKYSVTRLCIKIIMIIILLTILLTILLILIYKNIKNNNKNVCLFDNNNSKRNNNNRNK